MVTLLLLVVGMAVHLPWLARAPTEWDSVQLVMGVASFDVSEGTPHAPGYWLYIAGGRLVEALTPLGAHDSLLVCSVLAAGASVALAWVLGRDMGGPWLGAASAAVLLTSPVLLFYGSSVATYAFDAVAVEVLLLLAWRARPGSWHGPGAALALGLAAGFRQSSVLLLLPVAAVAVARSVRSARWAGASALAGVAGLAVWLVPMAVEQPGGLGAVQRAGSRIWREAVSASSPFYGAPADGVRYNLGQATGYTLSALALLLPALAVALVLRAWPRFRVHRGRIPPPMHSGPRPPRGLGAPALLAVAAVPPLAFLLVFHFGKAGYVLSYLPALVLLALWPATALARRPQLVVATLVGLACVTQAQRFASAQGILPLAFTDRGGPWFAQSRFGAPYRLTASAIDDVDAETERYRALGRAFDPERDVLVFVHLNGGHRFRHAMLNLPEFTAHYLQAGRDEYVGRRFRWRREADDRVELPVGSRAVFVVDEARAELEGLVVAGQARAQLLDTGPTVFVVPPSPGLHLFGVELAEGAAAPLAPGAGS